MSRSSSSSPCANKHVSGRDSCRTGATPFVAGIRRVREFCTANGIVYQGFSLLTANREVLASPAMARIAQRHGRTVSQIVFRFALDVGMIRADRDHRSSITCGADLEIFDFRLAPDEIAQIETLATTS